MKSKIIKIAPILLMFLVVIALLGSAGCSSPALEGQPSQSSPALANPADGQLPPSSPNAVKVVVAGNISHGPMQPTIEAIKDVLAKYEDKVAVTWVDLGTKEGAAYFKEHGLSAHMNVIINGSYTYQVNGKEVTFQWFEGQQWTEADLDAVLSNLVSKQ